MRPLSAFAESLTRGATVLGRPHRLPCPHSKFRASQRLPCNHCFLGSHLLLEIPVSDGIEQPSERRPLAETEGGLPFGQPDQFEGLDELLTWDILAQEAKDA